LTGTPLVNDVFEAAKIFNILKGPIVTHTFRIVDYAEDINWGLLRNTLKKNIYVDQIIIKRSQKMISVTQNPDNYVNHPDDIGIVYQKGRVLSVDRFQDLIKKQITGLGYKVVVIQKQGTSLENIIDKTGDHNIITRAIDIYHADFLIGIGSGLSWLSWALHKPTIMISGFSKPECEFSTKNYRIINTNVCNGCFNDTEHLFDRGDWDWCPRLKDTPRRFECSKSITPDMVFTKIQNLISNEGLK
jgi:hypothetical protein